MRVAAVTRVAAEDRTDMPIYLSGTTGFVNAGDFYIDTGYDDPGGASGNLAAARANYGCQVFPLGASAAPFDGAYPAQIRITAEPCFQGTYTPGAGITDRAARVWIHCSVWIQAGRAANNDFVELTNVSWALYKL